MPCMSGILRSSTIRSTGSIASRSMASRPLPACVDFTRRSEPSEVITMRRMVGESSTTKMLFILNSSDTSEETLQLADLARSGGSVLANQDKGIESGDGIVRETAKIAKTDVYDVY